MRNKSRIIKSTKHSIKFSNKNKKIVYYSFLKEYRRISKVYLDYLWNFGWICEVDEQILIFDISTNQFELPKFINYNEIDEILNFQTELSARVKTACLTQVIGCIKSSTEQRRKQLYILNKFKIENKDYSKLEKKTQKPLIKPNISNINPELSSKCCDFQQTDKYFNGFLCLKSIGKSFGKIKLPIKFHKNSNKWAEKGKMKTSFLFGSKNINIRWEIEKPVNKEIGLILGADQGMKTVLTLSSGQTTQLANKHGYSLEKIIRKLAGKKKGSKAFEATQQHRKNFINWSINQLNFDGIKQIRLEKLVNMKFGKSTSRLMSGWSNPLIRDKLISRCEELGVQVKQQSATYRSQRCSSCGLVRKANRKGKEYFCKGCGFVCDADLNAARNHEQELPNVPNNLRGLKKNLGSGFYWKSTGFFETTGEEFRVPFSKNKRKQVLI